MRAFFSITLAILFVLSVVAWRINPEPPGGDRTTLVWSTDNNPTRQAQVDLFNQLNPDLFLTIDPNNLEQQKVIVQSHGGVGPDIFDTYGKANLEAYVRSGIAYDITEAMRGAGIEVEKIIWPVAVPSCVYEGRVYGFPCNVNANAIWFNKDLFDEAGVPYPREGWTWEELIETGKKLTKRDSRGRIKQFGFYWSWNSWNERNDLIYSFGGTVFNELGTRVVLDSPEAKAAMRLAYDLMYTHRIMPTPVDEAALSTQGGWGSGGITYLMGGRVAMAFGGRWWLNLIRKEKPDLRLGVVEMPYAKVKTVVGGARCALVNAKSPRREVAIRFIQYLASPEYNQLLNDQADALAPVMASSYTDRFLKNPEYPNEDNNHIWREVVRRSRPDELNPFLRGAELTPISTQFDLVKADLKEPEKAMEDAARAGNERIRRVARTRPALGRLYQELTGEQP